MGTGSALIAAKDAEIQKLKHEIAQLKSYAARSSSSPVPPKSPLTSESPRNGRLKSTPSTPTLSPLTSEWPRNGRLKSTGAGTDTIFVFDRKDRDRAAESHDEIAQLKSLLLSSNPLLDKKKIQPLFEEEDDKKKMNLRWLSQKPKSNIVSQPSSCDKTFEAAARCGR
jgi:hypothetical protein